MTVDNILINTVPVNDIIFPKHIKFNIPDNYPALFFSIFLETIVWPGLDPYPDSQSGPDPLT